MALQIDPLRVETRNEDESTEVISNRPRQWSQNKLMIGLVIFVAVVLSLYIDSLAEEQNPQDVEQKVRGGGVCVERCTNHKKRRHERFGGDLLDRRDLLEMVQKAKSNLIAKLRVDYGTFFDDIFVNNEGDDAAYRPYMPITPDGDSMKRLKRKLMIKVLLMQTFVLKVEKVVDGCDCVVNARSLQEKSSSSREASTDSLPVDPATYARYVWATGGHSAAAGHGNLFNESYTAYLERDMKEIFGAIGIDFEGRNYAMGGTASGPEISMCWEQIFGGDVDFVTWDYGMTDGNSPQRLTHFGYRAAISPGRPAYLGVRVGGRSRKSREGCLRVLEALGASVFYGNDDRHDAMRDAVPESAGISEEEISRLPPLVRNLKCSGSFESGDPYCRRDKFSKAICPIRKKQTSWHPGYKANALDGHALALFLVEALIGAVTDLVEHKNQDPRTLLSELQANEDDLDKKLKHADIPKDIADGMYTVRAGEERVPDFDVNLFWQGKSLCRTGRLPAVSRYLGYTTNSDKVGNIAPYNKESFDVGFTMKEVYEVHKGDGIMQLVRDTDYEDCPVVLKPDYKDYFYTDRMLGKSKFVFPNEKEKSAYKYNPSDFKGLIILMFQTCDWGKCPPGYLGAEAYGEGKYTITVNDKPVKDIVDFGFKTAVLKGEDGLYWHPDQSGEYNLVFEVTEDNSHLRISSLILY